MINIDNLEEKDSISQNEVQYYYMMTFKRVNGRKVAYKIPISTFQKFYLNPSVITDIDSKLKNLSNSLENVVGKFTTYDAVEDANYLTEKDLLYPKSTLMTDDRLKSILNNYIDLNTLCVDINNCQEHCDSVLNSTMNSIVIAASQLKAIQSLKINNALNNAANAAVATTLNNKMQERISTDLGEIKLAIDKLAESSGEIPPSGNE